MDKQLRFLLGILFGLVIASVLLAASVLGWYAIEGALPQYTSTAPGASNDPADLPELTSRVNKLENDLQFSLRDIAWKMDQKLVIVSWLGLFISFTAGFIGIKTYNDLDKVIKEKINTSLEKALYQLDPTYLPIHIYKGRVRRNTQKGESPRTAARDSLPDVGRRLELTGLLNRGDINYLDHVTQKGITIIPMDDEKDEEEFIRFIKDGKIKLKPEEAGFILYAPRGYEIKNAQNAFENTTIANMPVTVASMVLVVGRGLKNRES